MRYPNVLKSVESAQGLWRPKRRPSLSHHFWEEEDKQMSLNNFVVGQGLAGSSLTKSQKSRMKSWRISKRISKLGCCCCWKDPFLLLSPKAKLSSLGWDCSSQSKHYKKMHRANLSNYVPTIKGTKWKIRWREIPYLFLLDPFTCLWVKNEEGLQKSIIAA